MKKIIIVLIILISCTGCWNYKELTELGLISAMAISKEDDKYIVDFQLINIIEGGDNGISESPITVVSGEGKTIAEAARSINAKSSKVNFPPNIEYVFLHPSVLSEDLDEVLDFLTRYTKLSLNFLVVTSTTNTPTEILSSLSTFNLNPASNLSELIKVSEERYGVSYKLSVKDFLKEYLDYGQVSVYPNIEILSESDKNGENETLEKSDSNNYVAVNSLVTFDKDGNTIILNKEESLGFNFLNNHITNATITAKCGDNYLTVETLGSKVKFKSGLDKDKIKITGDVKAELFFYGCEYDLDDDKTLDKISKLVEKEIENYIDKTINLAKTNNLDFIGIGNWIHKNEYDYFDFKKDNWNTSGLSKLSFDYDINVTLFKQGNLKGEV